MELFSIRIQRTFQLVSTAHGSQYAGRRKKDSFLFHLSLKF